MQTQVVEAGLREEYLEARRRLSAFVESQARETAAWLGFGWTVRNDAPDTFQKLEDAFWESVASKKPLPVSGLYCQNTIYESSQVNHAMRFWHDAHHVRLRLSFNLQDELELGLWHRDQLVQVGGFKPSSIECKLMHIDTVGQNYLLAITGSFPVNQQEFALRCLEAGVDEGVLIELRAATL